MSFKTYNIEENYRKIYSQPSDHYIEMKDQHNRKSSIVNQILSCKRPSLLSISKEYQVTKKLPTVTISRTTRSGEKVDEQIVEQRHYQYRRRSGNNPNKSFDRIDQKEPVSSKNNTNCNQKSNIYWIPFFSLVIFINKLSKS